MVFSDTMYIILTWTWVGIVIFFLNIIFRHNVYHLYLHGHGSVLHVTDSEEN